MCYLSNRYYYSRSVDNGTITKTLNANKRQMKCKRMRGSENPGVEHLTASACKIHTMFVLVDSVPAVFN